MYQINSQTTRSGLSKSSSKHLQKNLTESSTTITPKALFKSSSKLNTGGKQTPKLEKSNIFDLERSHHNKIKPRPKELKIETIKIPQKVDTQGIENVRLRLDFQPELEQGLEQGPGQKSFNEGKLALEPKLDPQLDTNLSPNLVAEISKSFIPSTTQDLEKSANYEKSQKLNDTRNFSNLVRLEKSYQKQTFSSKIRKTKSKKRKPKESKKILEFSTLQNE